MQLGALPSFESARRLSAVWLRRQVGGDGGGGAGGGGEGGEGGGDTLLVPAPPLPELYDE